LKFVAIDFPRPTNNQAGTPCQCNQFLLSSSVDLFGGNLACQCYWQTAGKLIITGSQFPNGSWISTLSERQEFHFNPASTYIQDGLSTGVWGLSPNISLIIEAPWHSDIVEPKAIIVVRLSPYKSPSLHLQYT